MKKYRVVHTSKYSFMREVSYCQGQVRLTPRVFHGQELTFSQIVFRPLASNERRQQDPFGNLVSHFEISRPLMSLSISAINTVTVDVQAATALSFDDSIPWDSLSRHYPERSVETIADIQRYTESSPLIEIQPMFSDYAQACFTPGVPLLVAVKKLIHQIHHEFSYDNSASHVGTTATQALQMRKGVCQDFSHAAIACLRSKGIAARYVTGYVARTPSLSKQEPQIASALSHAWFSVFEPDIGWVDFDPTNNSCIDENYITVSWGRDYSDVAPLTGNVAEENQHTMQVSIDIESL